EPLGICGSSVVVSSMPRSKTRPVVDVVASVVEVIGSVVPGSVVPGSVVPGSVVPGSVVPCDALSLAPLVVVSELSVPGPVVASVLGLPVAGLVDADAPSVAEVELASSPLQPTRRPTQAN